MKYFGRNMKRILALILVIAAVLPAAPALAETYYAVNTGGPLTVFASPTLTGPSITLNAYSVVAVSGEIGNVAQLVNGRYVGYANARNLRPLSEVATPAVSNRATRVFAQPNLSSSSVAIPKGFSMNVLYSNSTYAIVEYNGVVGYTVPDHLTMQSASQGSVDGNGIVWETFPATISVASLPFFQGASYSSKYLGALPYGFGLTVYAHNNEWAYVGNGGYYCFCPYAGLQRTTSTTTPPADTSTAIKVTVTADAMVVYQAASTASSVLGTLVKGVQVNLIRNEGDWAYIELNGNYGYCALKDLTSEGNGATGTGEIIAGHAPLGTATVVQAGARAYASMNTSSASAVMRMGDTLSFYGSSSKWVLVGRYGVFAFMLRDSLSFDSYAELKLENSGSTVTQLETALLALGYLDTIPSSNYTAITGVAVQRLQAALGMTATGIANLATLRVLYSGNAPTSPLLSVTLSQGSKNENVSRLQTRLYSLGYLSRQSSIDGDYGSNTASAVRLFQTSAGISATGTADSYTLRMLYSSTAPKLGSGQTAADSSSGGGTSGSGSTGNTTSIPAGLASTTSSYNSNMSNAEKLEYVIYNAQLQLGKPYVFGASGPKSFDCSGLMLYCFKKIGISLQHSAQGEGYNDKWQKITSLSSLRRGDMVFLNTVNDADLCDHVGIYLGSYYFLHAGSGAGKVIISSLSSGYYNRVFSWGRRVLA